MSNLNPIYLNEEKSITDKVLRWGSRKLPIIADIRAQRAFDRGEKLGHSEHSIRELARSARVDGATSLIPRGLWKQAGDHEKDVSNAWKRGKRYLGSRHLFR